MVGLELGIQGGVGPGMEQTGMNYRWLMKSGNRGRDDTEDERSCVQEAERRPRNLDGDLKAGNMIHGKGLHHPPSSAIRTGVGWSGARW